MIILGHYPLLLLGDLGELDKTTSVLSDRFSKGASLSESSVSWVNARVHGSLTLLDVCVS